MTRSPLAYPLNRSADMDGGGAADLQTDIMRFMAILSLCLVAIFALVQSIPITPAQPTDAQAPPEANAAPVQSAPEPVANASLPQAKAPSLESAPEPVTAMSPRQPEVAAAKAAPVEKAVALRRPTWVPKRTPKSVPTDAVEPVVATAEIEASAPAAVAAPPPPVDPNKTGYTLRFESDAALMRLVAANTISLYAIHSNRAQRMQVSDSRISFWDASTPNAFHEMESTTVPAAVVAALARAGALPDAVSWGVTLPGKLKIQLDELMQDHRGGALVIAANGEIRWEAS